MEVELIVINLWGVRVFIIEKIFNIILWIMFDS